MFAVSAIRIAAALVLALALTGCRQEGPGLTPPSSIEARMMLARLVALAHDGDFDGLCSTPGGPNSNCFITLEDAGRDVPAQPPLVVAERTMEAGPNTAAGRVLTLCGRAADGAPYLSEVLFFYSSGELTVIQPVWWSNTQIGDVGGEPVGSASTGQNAGANCP